MNYSWRQFLAPLIFRVLSVQSVCVVCVYLTSTIPGTGDKIDFIYMGYYYNKMMVIFRSYTYSSAQVGRVYMALKSGAAAGGTIKFCI